MEFSPTAIKIKEEKVDSQIEQKLKELKADIKEKVPPIVAQIKQEQDVETETNSCSTAESLMDDKKSIEPVKSSNEILAELFKVFNAAPPKELLDNKNLLKSRKHKKHKHKQDKKKKHKKGKSDVDSKDEEIVPEKRKHKKKRKHKQKDDEKRESKVEKSKTKRKDSSKNINKSKECKRYEIILRIDGEERPPKPVVKEEQIDDRKRDSSNRKRSHGADDLQEETGRSTAKSRCLERSRDYGKERERSHHNGSRERSVKNKKEVHGTHQKRNRHGNISDISLSDEESYLKERNRRCSSNGLTDRVRTHNSFYDGMDSIRSPKRDYERSRYRNSSRRSKSRSRSRDLGIDKKRLLEIARKNAISMFKRGSMPGCTQLTEEIKDKVLMKMRYGGRTVQDLTDFCKKISNGENLSGLSSDEDSDVDKSGNAKAFHHPFLLKDREPIVMHIRNAKPRVPSEDQTKAITMQFPVSSGQQHRMTEVWVPVETKDKLTPLPPLPMATQSTSIFKKAEPQTSFSVAVSAVSKNVFQKPMPAREQQEPAFTTLFLPDATTTATTQPTLPALSQTPALQHDLQLSKALAVPELPITNNLSAVSTITTQQQQQQQQQFVPDVPVPSTVVLNDSPIFPQVDTSSLDVSNIISKRLNAMRRLQDNPMDSEAIKMMHNSQREMTSWASSKHLPGQFTGSTGVNVLKAHELNAGPQLWVRRDQLTSTRPLAGGMGMHLLQKMGWKPGEGLGREKTGALHPLLLDVKLDKRGLVSKEDNNNCYHKQQTQQFQQQQQQQQQQQPQSKKQKFTSLKQANNDLQNKHPVCLLNEMSSKRKWLPPMYNLVNEMGPSHNKMFLFSVDLNGQTFTPQKASNTKKEAKLLAARYCLQQMGILP